MQEKSRKSTADNKNLQNPNGACGKKEEAEYTTEPGKRIILYTIQSKKHKQRAEPTNGEPAKESQIISADPTKEHAFQLHTNLRNQIHNKRNLITHWNNSCYLGASLQMCYGIRRRGEDNWGAICNRKL